jgi:sugar transferase (PEP-CTERM/EpsH1 system associated)
VRILWLKTELLHPVDKGGKIRTYHMLKELKRKHHITYLTLDDGSAEPEARTKSSEYCHELACIPHRNTKKFTLGFYAELAQNLASSLPYAIKKYQSEAMRAEIKLRTEAESFDAIVCDFLTPVINLPEHLPSTTVLFQHNVEAMIWKRHFDVQSNQLKKYYLYKQWRKMIDFERAASKRFDCVVAVSREDRETIQNEYEIECVREIPTGVDTAFFTPSDRSPAKNTLVFTGSMDWLPNEDAIRHFTDDILPLIRLKIPDVSLVVVGRDPYPSLLELSRRDPGIIVTGRVADVRPHIENAAAYVVPIRIGGGTRLKIYEAMAMGKPVISTTVGAEGLPLRDGTDLLLADTPESFSAAVIRVLSDAGFANSLGNAAAETVRAKFGWDKVAEAFAEICTNVVNTSSRKFAAIETAVAK